MTAIVLFGTRAHRMKVCFDNGIRPSDDYLCGYYVSRTCEVTHDAVSAIVRTVAMGGQGCRGVCLFVDSNATARQCIFAHDVIRTLHHLPEPFKKQWVTAVYIGDGSLTNKTLTLATRDEIGYCVIAPEHIPEVVQRVDTTRIIGRDMFADYARKHGLGGICVEDDLGDAYIDEGDVCDRPAVTPRQHPTCTCNGVVRLTFDINLT